MWKLKQKIMWNFCATTIYIIVATFTTTSSATTQIEQNNLCTTDYSITTKSPVTYYNYPAPPKELQFHPSLPVNTSSKQFTPLIASTPPSYQHSVKGTAQAHQNQYHQYHDISSYQQHNHKISSTLPQAPAITRQFTSPKLDNMAFNLALINRGYMIGKTPTTNVALTAISKSKKTSKQPSPATSTTPSSSTMPHIVSLNVKLPLPIGISPLNIGPLPLQTGAPFTSIPNGITSYGTPYPQRKRR